MTHLQEIFYTRIAGKAFAEGFNRLLPVGLREQTAISQELEDFINEEAFGLGLRAREKYIQISSRYFSSELLTKQTVLAEPPK